jgi:predicted glycoside hydrolase/deacetylase ChbG (UPF0249 family)
MQNNHYSIKLIVHADDLGMNKQVNKAIKHALEKGLLSSVSLMANGIEFEEGVRIAKSHPNISVGVHLNLSEFKPLSNTLAPTSIVDAHGFFNLQRKLWLNKQESDYVLTEWLNQIERIRNEGLIVSHLDSHHHVHTIPMLFPVLKKVQKISKIYKVRTTRNLPMRFYLFSFPKNMFKKIWHFSLGSLLVKTITTDYFGSVSDFLASIQLDESKKWNGSTIEIMCHPGHFNQEFVTEMKLLDKGLEKIYSKPFEVISYNDLDHR